MQVRPSLPLCRPEPPVHGNWFPALDQFHASGLPAAALHTKRLARPKGVRHPSWLEPHQQRNRSYGWSPTACPGALLAPWPLHRRTNHLSETVHEAESPPRKTLLRDAQRPLTQPDQGEASQPQRPEPDWSRLWQGSNLSGPQQFDATTFW